MRVYVHSTVYYLPVVGHTGQWHFKLPDGTFLIAIRHADIPVCRHDCAAHTCVKHLFANRASANAVPADTISILNDWFKEIGANLLTATATTVDVLTAIYAVTNDPIFHPDSLP